MTTGRSLHRILPEIRMYDEVECMKKTYEMDMCNGPILGKVLVYAFPLMLSGILQLLFNAADVVIVGRYAGSQSLAAVGSTSALINLLVNVFIGLSVGVGVGVGVLSKTNSPTVFFLNLSKIINAEDTIAV